MAVWRKLRHDLGQVVAVGEHFLRRFGKLPDDDDTVSIFSCKINLIVNVSFKIDFIVTTVGRLLLLDC